MQVYEIGMIILALIVVGILFLEIFFELDEVTARILYFMDLGILIVFTVEYGVRILIASNKKDFFLNNIWDLVAIIPFSSVFRVARFSRLTRLARMARLTRLLRIIAFTRRSLLGFNALLHTNNLHFMIIFTSFVVLLGAVGMYQLEQGITVDTFADSLWWSLVTTTTVGYGDISPATGQGRLLAAVLMLIGIGFVGMVTGTIATYFVKKTTGSEEDKPQSRNEIVDKIISKLERFDELKVKDIDAIYKELLTLKSGGEFDNDAKKM